MEFKRDRLVLAAILCALGYLAMAFMGVFSKFIGLGHHTSTFTILLFQNFFCLLFCLPFVIKGGLSYLKTDRIGLHLIRGIAGVLTSYTLFYSLKSISLVDGMLLSNTSPLWVPFIALIWPGFRIKGRLWIGIILGFIGVIFILKPGHESFSIGTLLALCSGIFAAVILLVLQKLGKTEPIYRTLFYYSALGTLIAAPFAFTSGQLPSRLDLMYLIGVGLSAIMTQVLVTYAFKHGKAASLGPISYISVVFSGILGWLIWHHVPGIISILGMILVIIGGCISIYFETKYKEI